MVSVLGVVLISVLQLLGVEPQSSELLFVGDAMQHKPQITNAYNAETGVYDYKECYKYLEGDIYNADFAVVNLEVPLGGKPYSGYPCFSAPDDFAKELVNVGFDLFCTANNHVLDRGDKGAKRTVRKLAEYGVPSIGSYLDAEHRDMQLPYIHNVDGFKIGLLNYTYGTNGLTIKGDLVVDYIDREVMANDIADCREAGAELVVVSLHWGVEYQTLPNREQRELADFLIDCGVDMIIGSHPHVVQPMEIVRSEKFDKDVLVVYSLGNFISNQTDLLSRGGAMVKVEIVRNEHDEPMIRGAKYKLFFTQKPTTAEPAYILIPESGEFMVDKSQRAVFDGFMRKTGDLLRKHNVGVVAE